MAIVEMRDHSVGNHSGPFSTVTGHSTCRLQKSMKRCRIRIASAPWLSNIEMFGPKYNTWMLMGRSTGLQPKL